MKKVLGLVGCIFFILAVAGCGQENGAAFKESDDFPESMVGVWEAEVSSISKWGIKFEPDGSISKIIHSLAGPVDLAEGAAYAEGPDDSYYLFVIGACEANYTEKTGILEVKIVVDDFQMQIPTGLLEGRIEDHFSGPVSEDGKTWNADWVNYGWLEGSDPPPIDILKANPIPLLFKKIDVK